jgi:hypothetical protein
MLSEKSSDFSITAKTERNGASGATGLSVCWLSAESEGLRVSDTCMDYGMEYGMDYGMDYGEYGVLSMGYGTGTSVLTTT